MIATIIGMRGCGKSTAFKALTKDAKRLIIVDTLCEHTGEVDHTFIDGAAVAEYFRRPRKRFRIGYAPEGPDQFNAVCRLAWGLGDCTLAIDEIDQYATAQAAPMYLLKLLRLGRHRAVDMIATVRRPADVPRAYTAASDTWYCFRIVEPRDRQYLSSILGGLADTLPELPKFRCVEFALDGKAVLSAVRPGGGIRKIKDLAA